MMTNYRTHSQECITSLVAITLLRSGQKREVRFVFAWTVELIHQSRKVKFMMMDIQQNLDPLERLEKHMRVAHTWRICLS